MIRRPPRSTQSRSSAASDVYKRQQQHVLHRVLLLGNGRLLDEREATESTALRQGSTPPRSTRRNLIRNLAAQGTGRQSAFAAGHDRLGVRGQGRCTSNRRT